MAVSYSDVKRVARTKDRIIGRAQSELGKELRDKTNILDKVLGIIDKYGTQTQEVGAQWYEYTASEAGVDVPRAQINRIDPEDYAPHVEDLIASWENGELSDEELDYELEEYVGETLIGMSRDVVFDNMRANGRADYRISGGEARIRYARIPVGETCAWCIMLASLGPWYLSYETAKFSGLTGDTFHPHCDCEVVPYSNLDDIDGYDETLETYRDMYYDARSRVENGDYSDEFKTRMDNAEDKHNERYEDGETDRKWRWYTNATLMMMRDLYGLH